ncbi:MAG: hypothetical protein ABL930_07050 [Pseudobdellovibrio sp.]
MLHESKYKLQKGFLSLALLPLLVAILYLVSTVVIVAEFKKEFRFICITESLNLQNKLLNNIESFNELSEQGSKLIFTKLKKIKSGVEYLKLEYVNPKIESQNQELAAFELSYYLQYKFLTEYELKCGVKRIKENNQWKNQIIY